MVRYCLIVILLFQLVYQGYGLESLSSKQSDTLKQNEYSKSRMIAQEISVSYQASLKTEYDKTDLLFPTGSTSEGDVPFKNSKGKIVVPQHIYCFSKLQCSWLMRRRRFRIEQPRS